MNNEIKFCFLHILKLCPHEEIVEKFNLVAIAKFEFEKKYKRPFDFLFSEMKVWVSRLKTSEEFSYLNLYFLIISGTSKGSLTGLLSPCHKTAHT